VRIVGGSGNRDLEKRVWRCAGVAQKRKDPGFGTARVRRVERRVGFRDRRSGARAGAIRKFSRGKTRRYTGPLTGAECRPAPSSESPRGTGLHERFQVWSAFGARKRAGKAQKCPFFTISLRFPGKTREFRLRTFPGPFWPPSTPFLPVLGAHRGTGGRFVFSNGHRAGNRAPKKTRPRTRYGSHSTGSSN
jgi:hypothetical protein